MNLREWVADPQVIREINGGITDGLRLRDGADLGRVLLLSADSEMGGLVTASLRRAGYRVTVAADLPQALRGTVVDGPDLVLVDLAAPGGDVAGGLAALRARAGGTPIAAFARSGAAGLLAAAPAIDADRLLVDPRSSRELLSFVRRLVVFPSRAA